MLGIMLGIRIRIRIRGLDESSVVRR